MSAEFSVARTRRAVRGRSGAAPQRAPRRRTPVGGQSCGGRPSAELGCWWRCRPCSIAYFLPFRCPSEKTRQFGSGTVAKTVMNRLAFARHPAPLFERVQLCKRFASRELVPAVFAGSFGVQSGTSFRRMRASRQGHRAFDERVRSTTRVVTKGVDRIDARRA